MSAREMLRLAQGGRIDRTRPRSFTFNGRPLHGFAGDTLASALLANGVRVVARSFKYHRPRGILSAGIEEPNALLRVAIDGSATPMVRASMQPLLDGMIVTSENGFPSTGFDLGRLLDYTRALWPAGFYNKTFKWPNWRLYEGVVRRVAGLGTLPDGTDRTRYYSHNLHCDVLIVGGGVVGLAAALEASRAGVRVVLVEQDHEFGGRLLGERAPLEGIPALHWVESAVRELSCASNVRLMRRTLVAGFYDHGVLTALDHSDVDHPDGRVERFWRIRAREVVLATGAIEQPLVFANNDRPGIMLAGAVRTYLNRYAVMAGRRVVIFTNNDDAYRSAFDLHDAGAAVVVVDVRARAGAATEEGIYARQLQVHRSSVIADTRGSPSVHGVTLAALDAGGRAARSRRRWIGCDAVGMSCGWNPALHLYSQSGGTLRYDPSLACLLPVAGRQRVRVSGAANGEFSLTTALASGACAGREAARSSSHDRSRVAPPAKDFRIENFGIQDLRRAPGGPASRQWVDFQHDVTTADIELAVRENYVSVEHLKRYTTNGMSVDQGKTSHLNALVLLAEFTGRSVNEVGTTTFRPPFAPVTIGAIGSAHGELYAPARHMPAHACHVRLGACFEDYGAWRRPACYRRAGEPREAAIEREVRAVRASVGLFDGSPLGKIEVRGPDAATFLHRIYVNNVLSLQPGSLRYGLMLSENGIVIDDGVIACLAPDHFLISTTSGNAERISLWLDEWHQCEWPQLDVVILPVTGQWAVLTLAGPLARQRLQRFAGDIDFSAEAFPHMSLRTGTLEGHLVRVQRMSFTGELGYEVGIAATQAEALWARMMEHAEALPGRIEPVGVEAWQVLRLEKGFLHVGTDTDGTTNPLDLGLGPLIARKTGDFIGRRSLMREHDRREDRRQLIGFEPANPQDRLVAGAHVVSGSGPARRSEGFVTSACFSPTLGRPIGLGLLERGRARRGETVSIFDEGRVFQARVVDPRFYDPRGNRMHG